jgi:GDPmannose 4,6-dehydratase
MRRALITGITGQDGGYLAQLLVQKGYEVFGTSRGDLDENQLSRLRYLGIDTGVTILRMAPSQAESVLDVVARTRPDEIYHLAAQSSVGVSFEHPSETLDSILRSTLHLLEAIKQENREARLFCPASSECFGDTQGEPCSERTAFRPRSPYAIAKTAAHELVASYRGAYGIFGCSGFAFNHESPLRPKRFVTQKIVDAAARIAAEKKGRLSLGTIDISRDWGWAPEYVVAMWEMLQTSIPRDYVIATGRAVSLRYFVEKAFEYFHLPWEEWVQIADSLSRPWEISLSVGDPSLIYQDLGWKATVPVEEIIARMCSARENSH